ncbi:MAG: tetratricopeptide repeat protein [Betaproteobacteria bacterium]|nr:tetratricopeptide repeat protein [Betaproteobacteria bacterium]
MSDPAHALRSAFSQAAAWQQAGQLADAEAAFRRIVADSPGTWAAWYNLGLILQGRNALDDAYEAYRQTIALNPGLAEAHNNLGNVLRAQGDGRGAIESFRRALARNPALAPAAYNLGLAFQAQQQHDSAIASFRQCLRAEPASTPAWEALWRSQLAIGRSDAACETVLQWERAAPLSPALVLAGLHSARYLRDAQREARVVEAALQWPFADASPAYLSPVLGLLQYFDVAPAALRALYQRHADAVAAWYRPLPAPAQRGGGARLRLGYVSGDFRNHVMGRLMEAVLTRHDAAAFDVHLFSIAPAAQEDDATARLRGHATAFTRLDALTDEAAAHVIAAQDIDVLVDLGGHTMSARPGIHAWKPARHIVTHLGYHGALGLHTIDGKISDAIADPPGNEAHTLEPPLRIDACVFPIVAAPPLVGEPLEPPAALAGRFVFAAFVNVLKLSPRCLSAWKRVLDEVPEAVLLFSPFVRADRAGLANACKSVAIDASRQVYLDLPAGDARLVRRHELAHAVLDTFPYAGGDTTLAALSMGVPVVTLAGTRHAERIGASLLAHVGVADLIAGDEDAFVRLAVRLAREPQWRQTLAERLRAAFADPDRHIARHVRALEDLYRSLVRRDATPTAPTPTSP